MRVQMMPPVAQGFGKVEGHDARPVKLSLQNGRGSRVCRDEAAFMAGNFVAVSRESPFAAPAFFGMNPWPEPGHPLDRRG
jgi:hypothetical protein